MVGGSDGAEGRSALSDIPVIVLSIVDEKQMGYALGAADYLPFIRLGTTCRRSAEIRVRRPPCPVLIVEDDESLRELLRRRLQKEQWTVIEAENGREGLERMSERTGTHPSRPDDARNGRLPVFGRGS
jgi:hypothetical protein